MSCTVILDYDFLLRLCYVFHVDLRDRSRVGLYRVSKKTAHLLFLNELCNNVCQ